MNLAALWAETPNRAFLKLRICLRLVLHEAVGALSLQLIGQIMEDTHTVLHRLGETRKWNRVSSSNDGSTYNMNIATNNLGKQSRNVEISKGQFGNAGHGIVVIYSDPNKFDILTQGSITNLSRYIDIELMCIKTNN